MLAFKFFLIIFPQPITQFLPIEILLKIIEPDPIKVLSPIVQLPFTMTPVDIWQLFPIFVSCSIKDLLFIIVFIQFYS